MTPNLSHSFLSDENEIKESGLYHNNRYCLSILLPLPIQLQFLCTCFALLTRRELGVSSSTMHNHILYSSLKPLPQGIFRVVILKNYG